MLSKACRDLKLALDERAKFDQSLVGHKFETFTAKCGRIDDFRKLRFARPNLDFFNGMEREHCDKADSNENFHFNKVTTCPLTEWQYVVERKPLIDDVKGERVVPDIHQLVRHQRAKEAGLILAEVLAIVLYTGPMHSVYNTVLRAYPQDKFEKLKGIGNLYTTTIFVLASAVQKLSNVMRISEGLRLYRGLGGDVELPPFFAEADDHGRRGLMEFGFMSTTSKQQIAVQYSGAKDGKPIPMIIEIRLGSVDCGAHVGEFSQFKREEEYLWAPGCFLEPAGPTTMQVTSHGVILVVPVRVNCNLKCMTVEEIQEEKKQMHLASFRYLQDEIKMELQNERPKIKKAWDAREKGNRGSGSERLGPQDLINQVMKQVNEVYSQHTQLAEVQYSNDTVYRGLVTEMLDVKRMAVAKVRWYIADKSKKLKHVIASSLRQANHGLQSYWEGVCKVQGLIQNNVQETDQIGRVRILQAAAEGLDASMLDLLVLAGADVNHEASDGTTPIFSAAASGRAHTIKSLASHGANVNALDKDGRSPLHVAAAYQSRGEFANSVQEQDGVMGFIWSETVKALIEARADLSIADSEGSTVIHVAAESGHSEIIELLVVANAGVNTINLKNGVTALHLAAEQGHTNVITALVTHRADINIRSMSGQTPCFAAASSGQKSALKLLVQHSADVNKPNYLDQSPMLVAARKGFSEIIELLSTFRGDVNKADRKGFTPLHAAAEKGHDETVDVLLQNEADSEVCSLDGWRPLHLAAMAHKDFSGFEEAHARTMDTLLKYGAERDPQDESGRTLLERARHDNHLVLEILERWQKTT